MENLWMELGNVNLPIAKWMPPVKIINTKAVNLAAVKTFWIFIAHRTLMQLIAVNKPGTQNKNQYGILLPLVSSAFLFVWV